MDISKLPKVLDHAALRSVIGYPADRTANKDRAFLHEDHKAWLAASPFCVISTASGDGIADVSPKGDPAGFVKVLDDTTIAIPERPGNRRADGFANIVENPNVGLLFFIPGRGDTMRINGRATLVTDAPFFDDMVVKGHRPILALIVEIDQVFFHCSKAFLRSDLWEPTTWRSDAVPPRAEIAQRLERPDDPIEEIAAYYGQSYRDGLYSQQ